MTCEMKRFILLQTALLCAMSAHIKTECRKPGLLWTSQVMVKEDFETNVGDTSAMKEFFSQYLEAMAESYGYDDIRSFMTRFLFSEQVDEYDNEGLIPSTAYMTYAVGMDYEMEYTWTSIGDLSSRPKHCR